MESQASNTNGSSGHLSHTSNDKVGPVLPIFVQMNIRHEEPYVHWKETSRYRLEIIKLNFFIVRLASLAL